MTFLFGGLTGIILASPPLDFAVSDSYFVVAHFHYTVFGTVVFLMFAGFYFWWPKWTGKMLDERIGMIHFWLLFIGFQVTFLIQHWLGAAGMPRRYGDYIPEDGYIFMNQISTFGSILLGLSTVTFLYNVWRTHKRGVKVTVDDPWGWGRSLEWATSCPPPRHNFDSIPRIRSESPAFDLHYPEIAFAEGDVSNDPVLAGVYGAPEVSTPRRHRARHRRGQGRGELTCASLGDSSLSSRSSSRWLPSSTGSCPRSPPVPPPWSSPGGLGFLVAFYLLFTAKRVEPLPEDDDEGDIAEGAGVQGFYSPHSWWPLPVALGAATIGIGLVYVMWWMIILGVVVTMVARPRDGVRVLPR